MDHKAIVEVVCKSAVQNLAGEIGTLLGHELQCSDIRLRLTTKDAFFNEIIREKSALSRMKVSGDHPGECYLLTQIESAVYLGGTLIMLPADMIEEHAQDGKLEGELEDAYGEVANIIAGVFTQAFVDKYPKTIRFIKETVEELVPTKIDLASDQPFPPGTYYITSCHLKAEERDLGLVDFIVPAAVFGLEELPAAEPAAATTPPPPQESAAESGWAAVEAQVQPPAEEESSASAAAPESPDTPEISEAAETAAAPEAQTPPPPPKPAFAEAKKLTDVIFNACIGQLSEEIGALIGQDLKCSDIQLVMTSKADFFAQHCQEKSILTQLKVTGDREGLGYLVMQTPDAIILGGTLIMLPEDQIEEQAQKLQFDGEVADAYGEVANILAGGLTQVFLERYPKQLRFIKTDAEALVPTQIDPASNKPFPEGEYYLASFAVNMEGYELHRILLLFPGSIFDLDANQAAGSSAQAVQQHTPEQVVPAQPAVAEQTPIATAEQPAAGSAEPAEVEKPVVLIVSEQATNAEPFVDILSAADYICKVLTYQDDIRQSFQQHQVSGVFLVMAQVGEKGFAAAIKLQSAGRPLPPLIFAGPEWTRSAVLRAAKYGARDIIIIPASNDEIQAKVSQHFRKAS